MATTNIELFRVGNSASARLDHVRPTIDISTFSQNGAEWVKAGSGGASTLEAMDLGLLKGKWWRLAAGTDYDDTRLKVWNDQTGHWTWDPTQDMPLSDYKDALAAVNVKFTLV